MPGPDGLPLGNRVFFPEEIYRAVANVPPDLLVYFGDLHYRAIGTVGGEGLFTEGDDRGPDGANHAEHGILALFAPGVAPARRAFDILDVAPTLLHLLGLPIPSDLEGRSLLGTSPQGSSSPTDAPAPDPSTYTPEERKAVEDRLRALGYL